MELDFVTYPGRLMTSTVARLHYYCQYEDCIYIKKLKRTVVRTVSFRNVYLKMVCMRLQPIRDFYPIENASL